MNLGELLSELRENILHDRSDRVAGTPDYLWSDATLVRYINEAHRRFARLSLIINDGTTPEVTEVTLVAGQDTYTLHQSVLSVRSAKVVGDAVDLTRAGHDILNGQPRNAGARFLDPQAYTVLSPGHTIAYSTDEEVGVDDSNAMGAVVLRVYPVPSAEQAGDVIKMRVIRLPIETFVPSRLTARPEIPEDHQLEMLDWAAYLALRIVDVDGGNPARAAEFRASFDAHVKTARNNVLRKLFAPTPWGFGRNGFAWGN